MNRQDIALTYPDALFLDGFDDVAMFDKAILGVTTRGRVLYSVDKIIDILITRHHMDEERAIEWFSYNIEGAHLDSDNDPICMQ